MTYQGRESTTAGGCQANGKLLCENGWQTVAGLGRVPCPICGGPKPAAEPKPPKKAARTGPALREQGQLFEQEYF